MELNRIYNEDCLLGMQHIPDKSVDMILCDLPYGTTACKWDVIIPFDKLWAQYERVIKLNGAIVLFDSEPFSTVLRMSAIKNYRYDWVWDKTRGSNFVQANVMPMKCHETISVFYKKKPTYNPQYWFDKPYFTGAGKRGNPIEGLGIRKVETAREKRAETNHEDGRRFPLTILKFKRDKDKIHPTQKPVALLEYLIKTYTNEGETVLDNCMGSGTTAIACLNTNRNFIGFEKDATYYQVATDRINKSANLFTKAA